MVIYKQKVQYQQKDLIERYFSRWDSWDKYCYVINK